MSHSTEEFNNRSDNILLINEICDRSANCISNIELGFTPVWAETGDVIISEIMADPIPEVALPGKEYLEITNRTENSFNLKDWKLQSEGQTFTFPDIDLGASEIAILCLIKDTSDFKSFGRAIGLKQFPTLTDGGKLLCLSDSTGKLIHGVEYSSDWYGDPLKSEGGWSLEMINTQYPFNDKDNWTVSLSRKGGTPGAVNSVSDE